jgi:hypothetical protein
MDVPLSELASTARAWDEQHLDVESAAHQVVDAPTGGFTAAVSGAAERFVTAWGRHTTDLAQTAEARADGLRATASDLVETDGVAAEGSIVLALQLRETR